MRFTQGGINGVVTHKQRVLKRYGLPDTGHSLEELAKISGVPLSTLKEVEKRGYGAYNSNPTSVRMKGTFEKGINAPMSQKLSPQQWARARVYSFIDKGKTYYTTDADLR